MDLFRYRSVAEALGIDDPATAPTAIEDWRLQRQKYGDLFAWSIARAGTWGYFGITAVAAIGLEVIFHKTSESWVQLCNACVEAAQPMATQEHQVLWYGYDQDGQPVYDSNTPIAYDTDGNPVSGDQVAPADANAGLADAGAEADRPEIDAQPSAGTKAAEDTPDH